MNNAVGYAHPAARPNPIVLGSDGIGADMLEELRLTYVRLREDGLAGGYQEGERDRNASQSGPMIL